MRSKSLGQWVPAVIVFLELIVYSAIQAPVPGVNEPQYLGKAAHFWDPTWAAGDLFLESSNPHFVFYLVIGWLTRFLTLETTAWVARGAGYGLLAVGWTRLASAVSAKPESAVISAACFLACGSIGNFSGEWLVGGIEGKVFSYALLFLAIAEWLNGPAIRCALWLGLSISFHPIVGVWGLVCGLGAALLAQFTRSGCRWRQMSSLIRPAIIVLVMSLPGIVPAMATLSGTSPRDAAVATYTQVFWRLRHHLDPTQFSGGRYMGYALLLTLWFGLLLLQLRRQRRRERDLPDATTGPLDLRWPLFVLLTVTVAIGGVIVGWHGGSPWDMPWRDLRAMLLKFYPFRLADVFVPLAFSLALSNLLSNALRTSTVAGGCVALATVFLFAAAIAIPLPDRNPSRMTPEQLTAWKEAAAWARRNTPPGTVFVTPSRQWGFKWFSHRAEYVNFKDSPQETAGLLEWKRRLDVLHCWWSASTDGRYSHDDLARLGEETGAAYLVTYAFPGRFASLPVYENGSYRIYSLR